MQRRHLLGRLAALAACPALAPDLGHVFAQADGIAPAFTLLVAGPDGGQTSRWGNACALAMSPCFPGSPNITTQTTGGLDGVTGANQLDALVVPDGKTAAILPGAALIAFLTGDTRVHFDPTRWAPLLSGVNSGVLMLRASNGTVPDLSTLRAAAPLRIAADQPQSRDLAALLGLARLGINTAPVFGLRDTNTKTNAFIDGEVDAVFLCGEGVPEDAAPLAASGAVPLFCLGTLDATGKPGPDPFFPGLPDAISLGAAAAPELETAYLAAAAAAQLDFLLVLPRLSDPNAVTLWAQAASAAPNSSPAFAEAASASSVSLQPAAALAGALAALALPPSARTSLQVFLAKNYGWQPG